MQVQNGEFFNLEVFAHKLRRKRNEEGATLKDFAARIGVALPTYQHYEGGKRKPPVEFVIMLARATGLSADYWLDLSGNDAEKNSPNGSTIIQTAKAIIDCAEEMKDSLGEKISKLKNELKKA
jgi:transcriptional regulator with XRE-family HTH domain